MSKLGPPLFTNLKFTSCFICPTSVLICNQFNLLSVLLNVTYCIQGDYKCYPGPPPRLQPSVRCLYSTFLEFSCFLAVVLNITSKKWPWNRFTESVTPSWPRHLCDEAQSALNTMNLHLPSRHTVTRCKIIGKESVLRLRINIQQTWRKWDPSHGGHLKREWFWGLKVATPTAVGH
jgi:hypothetical protein